MKIALIGCGEVGHCYARAWTAAGHTFAGICELRTDDEMVLRAQAAGATLHNAPGPWLAHADVVVSAVYGYNAAEVARQAYPHMRAGAVYADFTTASAPDMQKAAAAAAPWSIPFMDVAIMGAIALLAEKTPLLCAGEGAQQVTALGESAGAPVRIIEGKPGDAVRLKLLRSVMTKGMESLAVECMVAAERMGLRESLYEVLADIDRTPLTAFMDSFVRSHVLHAPRRLAEVREARDQIHEAGLEPLVLNGVEQLFARSARAIEAARAQGEAPAPDTVQARLAWLSTLARQS